MPCSYNFDRGQSAVNGQLLYYCELFWEQISPGKCVWGHAFPAGTHIRVIPGQLGCGNMANFVILTVRFGVL